MDSVHFLWRPIVFHTPERAVDPPSWLGHTPFAFWIVDVLRPATFVELGCHSGNSYSSVAQAVQTLGLPTACYAVDTWLGDPHSGALDERVFAEWSAYHDRRFASFSRLIRSTFDEALDHFSDGAIDLLHIDGYHTFDALAHDFEAWRPRMSDRGVVLCHDINVREKDFGAWRVWERVSRDYPSFAFHHGHGLGVLGIGRDLPPPLQWLFSAGVDEANATRLFFGRLGASVTAEHAASAAQQAAADAHRAVAELRQTVAGSPQASLKAQQNAAAELARRDQRRHQMASELDALRSEITHLQDASASAERTHAAALADLTAENRQLTTALGRAEQALTARTEEVAALAARLDVRETVRTRPTVVVVSHVGAWQPRAGNEYRLHRMLQWYRRQGYRVIPVIAPLPGGELPREVLSATADAFGNAIQVHRDGRVEHDLRDVPDPFDAVPGRAAVPIAVDDRAIASGRGQELLAIDSTFCHDHVIATVLQLQQWLGPHVLQVEYIWMVRLLPLVRGDVLKVVDTHDVFSSIEHKVRMFGLQDVVVDAREEATRLRRADLIVAIQDDERQALQRLAPGVPVVTAGVDFDVAADAEGAVAGRILFVASNNPRNRKGLTDFVRLAWPRIRRAVADATLVVVGDVAQAIAGRRVPGVTLAGAVDDVAAFYREASLVINPVVAGTGAKIKTLEALARLRPIVTWPAGVDGLDPQLAARCAVARDWYEFSNAVTGALTARGSSRFTDEDRAVVAELLSADATYASLDAAYRTFFERRRRTPTPASSLPDALLADTVVVHA